MSDLTPRRPLASTLLTSTLPLTSFYKAVEGRLIEKSHNPLKSGCLADGFWAPASAGINSAATTV